MVNRLIRRVAGFLLAAVTLAGVSGGALVQSAYAALPNPPLGSAGNGQEKNVNLPERLKGLEEALQTLQEANTAQRVKIAGLETSLKAQDAANTGLRDTNAGLDRTLQKAQRQRYWWSAIAVVVGILVGAALGVYWFRHQLVKAARGVAEDDILTPWLPGNIGRESGGSYKAKETAKKELKSANDSVASQKKRLAAKEIESTLKDVDIAALTRRLKDEQNRQEMRAPQPPTLPEVLGKLEEMKSREHAARSAQADASQKNAQTDELNRHAVAARAEAERKLTESLQRDQRAQRENQQAALRLAEAQRIAQAATTLQEQSARQRQEADAIMATARSEHANALAIHSAADARMGEVQAKETLVLAAQADASQKNALAGEQKRQAYTAKAEADQKLVESSQRDQKAQRENQQAAQRLAEAQRKSDEASAIREQSARQLQSLESLRRQSLPEWVLHPSLHPSLDDIQSKATQDPDARLLWTSLGQLKATEMHPTLAANFNHLKGAISHVGLCLGAMLRTSPEAQGNQEMVAWATAVNAAANGKFSVVVPAAPAGPFDSLHMQTSDGVPPATVTRVVNWEIRDSSGITASRAIVE